MLVFYYYYYFTFYNIFKRFHDLRYSESSAKINSAFRSKWSVSANDYVVFFTVSSQSLLLEISVHLYLKIGGFNPGSLNDSFDLMTVKV